jgi:ABC-type branched-subunit amino acid transport system substrate-binding protein
MKSFHRKYFGSIAVLLAVLFVVVLPVRGQGTLGVTDKEIVIGSCSALQGPSSFLGTETVRGASAYFKMINEDGGINDRKVRLVSYDDSYDPTKTEECFQRLMKDKVFALGFFVGTPTAVKYLPLAETNKIPLVGLFTGAQTIYTPLRHWTLNVRASYFDETHEQIEGLWTKLHYKKIAVIHPDDAFGNAVLEGVKVALKAHDAEPSAVASYPRQTQDVDAAIEAVRATAPDAVVVVGPSNTVAPILKQSHAKDWKPLFLTVSFVGTDDLIAQAGEDAEGVVITQVVPPYSATNLSAVAMYRKALQKYFPTAKPNFVSLEGFVDALVMSEGIRRAGHDLTREGYIKAMESLPVIDLGLGREMMLNFSASSHKGFSHVIPTVVRNGKAVVFVDWTAVAPK